ncbi:urocanase, partial [Kipferlia bialata]
INISEFGAEDLELALSNALRYFPKELHPVLAPEFAAELKEYGHIYMYRFLPTFEMKAYPLTAYPAKCVQAQCIMHMIMNNLDHAIAQYPHELITYGTNGSVLQNWAQFWLLMQYLSVLEEDQTLALYSGHPHGVFPSSKSAPRMVVTNGMVIWNYSKVKHIDY